MRSEITFVFVLGDHGNGAEDCDKSRPYLSLFAPKRLPEAQLAALAANQDALTTPFDLRATVRDLAGLPDFGGPVASTIFSHLGKRGAVSELDLDGDFAVFRPTSFLQPIPLDRSAGSQGPSHCSLLT